MGQCLFSHARAFIPLSNDSSRRNPPTASYVYVYSPSSADKFMLGWVRRLPTRLAPAAAVAEVAAWIYCAIHPTAQPPKDAPGGGITVQDPWRAGTEFLP